jgi:hypothetical protein
MLLDDPYIHGLLGATAVLRDVPKIHLRINRNLVVMLLHAVLFVAWPLSSRSLLFLLPSLTINLDKKLLRANKINMVRSSFHLCLSQKQAFCNNDNCTEYKVVVVNVKKKDKCGSHRCNRLLSVTCNNCHAIVAYADLNRHKTTNGMFNLWFYLPE